MRVMDSHKRVVDPLTVQLETIQVPRAWIREHGWPTAYDELVALLATEAGVQRCTAPRGAIAMQATRALDLAFFRPGPEGQAFLYVQAWVGPA